MEEIYFKIKIVAALIDFILLFIFALSVYKVWRLLPDPIPARKNKGGVVTIRRAEVETSWFNIQQSFANGTPESLKLAVIDADKLIDNVLKMAKISGETMGERLEQIRGERLSSYDRLWRAHRLRNEIVHSPDFSPSRNDIENALISYEAFLRELKIL